MNGKVTCPGCGARLTYRGSPKGSRNCPKCQTLISFDALVSNESKEPLNTSNQPIDAEPVIETKPQEAVVAPAPASDLSKRSPVIWILLGGLAAAMAGFMVLIVGCAGIAFLMFSGGRHEPADFDRKVAPVVYSPSTYDGKASDYSSYTPPYSYSDSSSSAPVAAPNDAYAASSGQTAPATYDASADTGNQDWGSGYYGDDSYDSGYGAVSDTQWETHRQLQSDYWNSRADQAQSYGNSDDASRFRSYGDNP